MTLNEKIIDILKQHPEGGERFFNALDLMIRSDQNIGKTFINWVCNYDFYHMISPITINGVFNSQTSMNSSDLGVIVTGRFGHYIMSNFAKELTNNFKDVIVVNGGIREGKSPEIFKSNLEATHYILLDDSYYSGTTMRAISEALGKINHNAAIIQTFVVYDGSKDSQEFVKSMYRYYE